MNINTKLSSKDLASQRLRLILIHDRSDSHPDFLETIKGEILSVIAKYIEIDNSDIEVTLMKSDIEKS